jgi:hypothetical protein
VERQSNFDICSMKFGTFLAIQLGPLVATGAGVVGTRGSGMDIGSGEVLRVGLGFRELEGGRLDWLKLESSINSLFVEIGSGRTFVR